MAMPTTKKSSSPGHQPTERSAGSEVTIKDTALTGTGWNSTLLRGQRRSAFMVSTGHSWPELHPADKAGRWPQWPHLVLQVKDHIHLLPTRNWYGSEVSQMPVAHRGAEHSTHQIWNGKGIPKQGICPSQTVRALYLHIRRCSRPPGTVFCDRVRVTGCACSLPYRQAHKLASFLLFLHISVCATGWQHCELFLDSPRSLGEWMKYWIQKNLWIFKAGGVI